MPYRGPRATPTPQAGGTPVAQDPNARGPRPPVDGDSCGPTELPNDPSATMAEGSNEYRKGSTHIRISPIVLVAVAIHIITAVI